jgi:tRNA(Arg) A34 adenosine deaminase TadA
MNLNGAPLAYGYNTYSNGDMTTEHAEAMAFRKLNSVRKHMGIRGRLSVNILVIRTNGGNSKPCSNCIQRMINYSSLYTIRKVYYTNKNEPDGIQKESFSSLINDPNKHMSAYYRFQQQKNEDKNNEHNEDGRPNPNSVIINVNVKYKKNKPKKATNKWN